MNASPNGAPALVPGQEPLQAAVPEIPNGDLAAIYYGQRRGGDFYDFRRASKERVLFGLFDAAGDLERARPVVSRIQQEFRSSAAPLFGAEGGNQSEALRDLWLAINRAVMEAAGGVHSCPAFFGCYSHLQGTIAYVNAGHTPGLIRHGGNISELRATALPLGLFSHSIPDSSVVALTPGDTLLLVSRGIVEACHKREEYGLERVKDYLHQTRFVTARETSIGMLARVRQFMQTSPTHNDVTVLALAQAEPLDRGTAAS
jgi:serine phosphatase RsbU (regulator of sigma subunit)